MSDCMFFCKDECRILRVTPCPNKCSFRKTRDEYIHAQAIADKKLKEKGRVACTKSVNGKTIMTTMRAPKNESSI